MVHQDRSQRPRFPMMKTPHRIVQVGHVANAVMKSLLRFLESRLRVSERSDRAGVSEDGQQLQPTRQFRGHSSVKTWILGVAANVARHHQRSEQRRRVNQDRFASAPAPAAPTLPDAEVDRRRLLIRIAEALATLPYDQQVAFVLCDLEQLPGIEVARTFEIPEGTLWRRLHVARNAVRAALARRQP